MRISKFSFFLVVSAVSAAVVSALTARLRPPGRTAPADPPSEPQTEQANHVRRDPQPNPGSLEDEVLDEAGKEGLTLEEMEKAYILRMLDRTDGNQSRSAEILGISRRTLYRKMRDYGILAGDE